MSTKDEQEKPQAGPHGMERVLQQAGFANEVARLQALRDLELRFSERAVEPASAQGWVARKGRGA